MNRLARPEEQGLFPDITDLFEFPFASLRNPVGFRVEAFVREGRYVVRAEIPGIDPVEDLVLTVEPGALTVTAERREEEREKRHSEFRYGSFSRTIALPKDADEEDVSASYRDGILEVTVGLTQRERVGRRITVEHGD
ncbi:Hsp20/alpha crystallin family protein [Nocardiopsis composta]|uniref:HSP20 family molecular chaperone IbpA n=1 Tax=Nocardiopsis composta TaxID=157465 RepID=A0A7W8QJ19_9ACTN|nr:Hsp20/alpha crystallin family protein [Nocardiopsis composta]MBB5431149.1 HSP20 family molecular chaperone IbpA [Nocardiopsis composta]